jgi:hypothetical protein
MTNQNQSDPRLQTLSEDSPTLYAVEYSPTTSLFLFYKNFGRLSILKMEITQQRMLKRLFSISLEIIEVWHQLV